MKKILSIIIAVAFGISALLTSSVSAITKPYVVSIGDSVAAGVGLPAANGLQNQLCERSKQSYPYVVARELDASKLLHIPCTGAKINQGVYGEQVIKGTTKSPQLERAFAYGKPDILLITIGANDMRWRQFAGKCLIQTCGTTTDKVAAAAYYGDLYYELGQMIRKIDNYNGGTAASRPQIYISGYYNPLADTQCISQTAVTASEQAWISQQVNRLNNAIRRVAEVYRNVEYVPVDFSGHGVCASEPWIQPIDITNPTSGALHPNAAGHQAMAQSFLQVIQK